MRRQRDYKSEYARRIANATAKGRSRSQARGHARHGEPSLHPSSGAKVDHKLEAALREFRRTGNRGLAAKSVNVAPERFSRFLRETVELSGRGRSLRIIDNRPRDMTVISGGELDVVRLRDFDQASLNGEYLAAVGQFLRTNDLELLLPLEGREVIDAKGKRYALETDPNELHRLAAQGDELFHAIYRLVFTGG